ncbi:MAG: hypothetical protein HOP13_12360 [Alphaproteobacteria bacterium]|nr:hypothetical protein [Alphaproteobacteria bacterium]
MLDRIFAFLGAVILVGLSGIAVATSIEVQSVLMLFATLLAYSVVASTNKTRD